MSGLKKLLKYTPPDFRNFSHPDHGMPRGLLSEAWISLAYAIDGYHESQREWLKGAESFAQWPSEERGCSEDDLVTMYAGLAKAEDMLSRLEAMEPAERKKHLELDSRYDYDKAIEYFAVLSGAIEAWELESGEPYITVLGGLLKRRIDEWENKFLPKAAEEDFVFEYGDELETVNDYCRERTIMEYAVVAINILRISGYETEEDKERLEDVPYFDTYVERLKTSDVTFRKLLNGRRDIEAWADDPDFWWHREIDSGHTEQKCRTTWNIVDYLRREKEMLDEDRERPWQSHATFHELSEEDFEGAIDERDKKIWKQNWEAYENEDYKKMTKEEFIRGLREIEDEMESDRRTAEACLALWERLQEQAKIRPLSETEKRDVYYCELNFGGREKLLEYRRKKGQS